MQGDDAVRLGETGIEAVFQHRHGAEADLFGGLGDHDQRALPFGLAGNEFAGRADPAGHVDVVTAGVHDAGFFAGPCRIAEGGGVGEPGFLDEWQRVHVGADHQRGAGAVLEDGDKAVAADAVLDLAVFLHCAGFDPLVAKAGGDGEAEALHLGAEDRRGVLFLEGEFGILVEVLVDLAERLAVGGEGGLRFEIGRAHV